AYTLRSRMDEVRDFKIADVWAKLEAPLRRALQEAADRLLALGKINAAGHEKYFLSLTDQEIIQGLPGYRHVTDRASAPSPGTDGPPAIAFFREIVSKSSAAPAVVRHYSEQEP